MICLNVSQTSYQKNSFLISGQKSIHSFYWNVCTWRINSVNCCGRSKRGLWNKSFLFNSLLMRFLPPSHWTLPMRPMLTGSFWLDIIRTSEIEKVQSSETLRIASQCQICSVNEAFPLTTLKPQGMNASTMEWKCHYLPPFFTHVCSIWLSFIVQTRLFVASLRIAL
jgi:hypothetical protein